MKWPQIKQGLVTDICFKYDNNLNLFIFILIIIKMVLMVPVILNKLLNKIKSLTVVLKCLYVLSILKKKKKSK